MAVVVELDITLSASQELLAFMSIIPIVDDVVMVAAVVLEEKKNKKTYRYPHRNIKTRPNPPPFHIQLTSTHNW